MDNEWISVTDRMPEPYVGVLVTDGTRVTAAQRYKVKERDFWFPHEIYGHDAEVSFDNEVTHWAPLKPPPKSK